MSKLLAIQIMLLLWLMCQCDSISAQTNVMGYSSLFSPELVMSIAAVGLQVAYSRVVYVIPNATAPCPMSDNSSCHTLSWYSHSDRERLLSNDTVHMVILLKGIHILNSTLHIENHKDLTIKGEDGYTLLFTNDNGQTPHPVTWINCTSSAETGIVFLNSTDIKIVNLGFDSCGTNAALNSGAGEFNVSAALFFGMSYNVSISQVIIDNTYGNGLHMNCVFGNIWINDCILVRASKERDRRLGGNAKFQWFGQSSRCKNQCSTKIANLTIFRSWFMQGLNGSIGIEIIIDCPQVYVLMSNVNAVNNTGGNIALSLTTFDGYAPTISKVYIIHSIINGGSANIGGGIRVRSRYNQERESIHIVNSNNNHMHGALLTVCNTNFSFNSAIERGGAVYISHYRSYCIGYFCQVENVKILFKNCSFINNFGNGAAIETKQHLSLYYHTWIGCLKNSSPQSCELIVGHVCIYCNPEPSLQRTVSVSHLDDQCLPGRTGIMCGACKPGFSRILEQFRVPAGCVECPNTNLAFLIPLFLFSGIILVIFLTIFNMTVTEGAINGLTFYSSVAYAHPRFFHTNQPVFIPWIFVSWLNLDLGFEICAYNGMTGYQYIWLSFGYIFCLIFTLIFIIYLSQKFISFTRLVRRNATSVLATIIILAYSRVIFVCYHSLNRNIAYVNFNALQVDRKDIWAFDGNMPYLGSKHIPLFILAIICLLALLWFTFSLLLIQCLQKRSNIWCLRWVERLRPFFEAYTGPCNNNARFWPGFLLLLRLGLFVVEIQEYGVTLVAGICFLIIPLACIFPHGVYKKWPLNVLELLFVLNLGITFVVVQYTGNSHSDQIKTLTTGLAAQLSTSFAIIMFFGILLYHIYRRIKGTPVWKKPTKLVSAGVKKLQVVKRRWSHKDDESDDEKELLLPQPLPPVIKFPEYREPLLED